MAKKLTAKAKMVGFFPASRTSCSYNTSIPEGMGVKLAAIFVGAFRTTMSELYPADETRPQLAKITITITLP